MASVILPEKVPVVEMYFFKDSLNELPFEKELVLLIKMRSKEKDRLVKLRIDTDLINFQFQSVFFSSCKMKRHLPV